MGEVAAGQPVTPFAFVVESLAVYRLTKLVVDDQLTAGARDRVIEAAYITAGTSEWARGHIGDNDVPGAWAEVVGHDQDPPKIAYLVTCPWCAGMYVALAAVVARRLAPRWWARLVEVLALSAVAGLVAENLQEH